MLKLNPGRTSINPGTASLPITCNNPGSQPSIILVTSSRNFDPDIHSRKEWDKNRLAFRFRLPLQGNIIIHPPALAATPPRVLVTLASPTELIWCDLLMKRIKNYHKIQMVVTRFGKVARMMATLNLIHSRFCPVQHKEAESSTGWIWWIRFHRNVGRNVPSETKLQLQLRISSRHHFKGAKLSKLFPFPRP